MIGSFADVEEIESSKPKRASLALAEKPRSPKIASYIEYNKASVISTLQLQYDRCNAPCMCIAGKRKISGLLDNKMGFVEAYSSARICNSHRPGQLSQSWRTAPWIYAEAYKAHSGIGTYSAASTTRQNRRRLSACGAR